MILDRLLLQHLADTIHGTEGAGQLVFFFQGSKVPVGRVAFGRFLDHHRMGIFFNFFDRDNRIAAMDNTLFCFFRHIIIRTLEIGDHSISICLPVIILKYSIEFETFELFV